MRSEADIVEDIAHHLNKRFCVSLSVEAKTFVAEAIKDAFTDLERNQQDQIEELEGERDELEAEVDEIRDERGLLENIFEALVAASEGNPVAAKWALGKLTQDQEFARQVPTARMLAKTRPADYWAHG